VCALRVATQAKKQKELAKDMGLSVETLSRTENGRREIEPEEIFDLIRHRLPQLHPHDPVRA
jgi:transcriptional regulator with XRE-family HTH domain